MRSRNIYERRTFVVAVVFIFAVAGAAAAFGAQALESTNGNALTGNVYLTSDYGQVWGFNGSGQNPTWEAATLTTSGHSVVASFAAGFNVTHVVLFQKNPKYDVQSLQNTSYLYSTLNVGTAVDNATSVAAADTYNLTYASLVFGTQINSTSLHSAGAKSVIQGNAYATEVYYTSGTNNLNQSEQLDYFGVGSTSYTDYASIVIDLSSTGISSSNHLSLTVSQDFQQPMNVNLITLYQSVIVIVGVALIGLVIIAMPRMSTGGR
jgi:hypothetical protein